MVYIVTLQHTDEQFTVNSGESILQAGLRQGIRMPYGCENGVCGTCICKIVIGTVECPDTEALALFDEDGADKALCCVAIPSSDLTIEFKYPDIDFEPWV